MASSEVLGLDSDRELIRLLARRLAQDHAEAARIRRRGARSIGGASAKGGILAALRRPPLVGAALDPKRPRLAGRKIEREEADLPG